MMSWVGILQHLLDAFNVLTIAYFWSGNGIYTALMLVSLAFAVFHKRRRAYEGLEEIRRAGMLPPVTIIIPAYNEENSILETIRSARCADYPGLRVVVVDDGSTDSTLSRLITEFGLTPLNLIYRAEIPTGAVTQIFTSPEIANLAVIQKEHVGKADALNAGINFCRTSYFCTLDADCLIEPDALLRLMRPIVCSNRNVIASNGVVCVGNGCKVVRGRVQEARLPKSLLERLQVVEYLRSFLFGRAGWNLIDGTLVASGAMAVFHRQRVVNAGGFSSSTVGEDTELIVRLQRDAERRGEPAKISFSFDPVCWTQCPASLSMLARQRRRWQLGLCQTLWLNSDMLFNPKFRVLGLFSFPFHACVECLGSAVEFLGYLAVPLAFLLHLALWSFYLPLVFLSLLYSAFLSVGAVLLDELTSRRYPRRRDLYLLLATALIDNFGYRQLILCYRVQGLARFLTGFNKWEKVAHTAEAVTG
jgi:cellulose synthase/poly-beta-1,6-N-acetylglucosamine synthase-like glycosyltransferase